jgi:myosin heavy subunit
MVVPVVLYYRRLVRFTVKEPLLLQLLHHHTHIIIISILSVQSSPPPSSQQQQVTTATATAVATTTSKLPTRNHHSTTTTTTTITTRIITLTIQIHDVEFVTSTSLVRQGTHLTFSYEYPCPDDVSGDDDDDNNNNNSSAPSQQQQQQQQPQQQGVIIPTSFLHKCNRWWRQPTRPIASSLSSSTKSGVVVVHTIAPNLRRGRYSHINNNNSHNKITTVSSSSSLSSSTSLSSHPPTPTPVPIPIPVPIPPHDLTCLEQLHEPAVLYCLYCRFQKQSDSSSSTTTTTNATSQQQHIYTYTGKILIAMNPFIAVPYLYGEDQMQLYYTASRQSHPIHNTNTSTSSPPPLETLASAIPFSSSKSVSAVTSSSSNTLPSSLLESSQTPPLQQKDHSSVVPPLPPHVYAIAQEAYSSIWKIPSSLSSSSLPQPPPATTAHFREYHTTTATHNNQCILVSGESGAGKTVTTKMVLQYLAYISQLQQQQQEPQQVVLPTMHTATISTNTGNNSTIEVTSTASSIRQSGATPLSPSSRRRRRPTALIVDQKAIVSATPTGTAKNHDSVRRIELQVLESNPILESFGNARTIRNDNSSRFGKYIELSFNTLDGCIVSATIETYLLEKVRLISQSYQERNYHIFYEILAPPMAGGLSTSERQSLHVTGKSVHDFHMTCISQTYDRRDNIKDRDTYRELRHALDMVGFTRLEQMDLFTVVCALLYTSNITVVVPIGSDASSSSTLDVSNPSLRCAVELFGVDSATLNNALCTCSIEARNEVLMKHLSIDRATKAVEALIKTTYAALFTYIVRRINSFITVPPSPTAALPNDADSTKSRSLTTASIGILDIFGFESFEHNSFEQLCINYCNEVLQQQFNKFVFKFEQEEYEREEIDWSFISFPDNQDVLDLISKRYDGILSILDEQCRLPRCTDATFANTLYQKCSQHPRIQVTKAMQAQFTFAIHHYAGLVEYDTEGFIEKNQDELPKGMTELLQSSSNPFFVVLSQELLRQSETSNNSSQQQYSQSPSARLNRSQMQRSGSSLIRDSVGTQFNAQLKTLRTRIESTTPHYIRCLKPNDDFIPYYFDSDVVADQLRCAGVLEAIRVSRVGFPNRYFHEHFVQRYGLLERPTLHEWKVNKGSLNAGFQKEQCVTLVDLILPKILNLTTNSGHSDNRYVLLLIRQKVFTINDLNDFLIFGTVQFKEYKSVKQRFSFRAELMNFLSKCGVKK